MSFQILALESEQFDYLTKLSDQELKSRNIDKCTVDTFPGYPCRITLDDAPIGETVFLLNYKHLDAETPYQAAHAIYVQPHSDAANPKPDAVPDVLMRRPISLRGFDRNHRMVQIGLAEGDDVAKKLTSIFEDQDVSYVHLHNALPGCFAAKAVRA